MRGNHLSGQIPDEIGDCSFSKSLDLSFNELYGDILFLVSELKQLEHLILKNNQLIGPIPSTLSQIPNLKLVDLAQNKLSGEIPRLIYWNEILQYLGLQGNNLVGTLSPDMCQLTRLWYFDVRNNSLIGSIPQNIGNCTAFQVLHLTEEIPFNIGFLQVATLSLQGNQLSGKISSVIGLILKMYILLRDLIVNFLIPISDVVGICMVTS
ncbi:LRR receptor-like serine/threonine-protein kinase ERECTA isoform X4 [Camellia sinensis]|nr:LRR receptor-like serine/threonine-protein kinase ERECTA isoform X4 [Camellia sinensis]XP_028081129.1 LRR receptor-like serine/threonine-protein kinase ERECTA isoform X4 [Camellia sinensis]XP_028081130.1 LRR receptor-like serine/threonine-protein kinase ERECTA isoform X4 [Camellia sinensis]XP_028081131.1 LRR receptor-like serine/threonine-protein kinase ERECTA isoform X4 [Camellia sinensis]XP_028081132.1 LRR receptor-like serine/threonine-protein kinase ERECTA isoform X4 [Camellia sinensis]